MNGARVLDAGGDTLWLLPDKAVYWPAAATLVVADIHFGKAAAFRARGVPVPAGTTADNLARLDRLVARHAATRIVFLGDFLHARAARAPATLDTLLAWRARQAALTLVLVRGNHDRHAGDPPAALDMRLVDEPWGEGPFAFCHHPGLVEDKYMLAGHVHPVYTLASRFDALRLPCFVAGPGQLLLPAFGAFTGGHPVQPAPRERLFVTDGDAVHAVRWRTDAVAPAGQHDPPPAT